MSAPTTARAVAAAAAGTPETAPTPVTLARHELVGLAVRVVAATDPTLVGRAGHVLDETERTLVVADGDGERTVLPKLACTFEIRCEPESALARTAEDDDNGGPDREYDDGSVVVEGARLVASPARRTETERTRWQ